MFSKKLQWVTQSPRSLLNNLRITRSFSSRSVSLGLLSSGLVCILGGILFYALKQTAASIHSLSQGEVVSARTQAQHAQRIVYPLTFLTAHRLETLTAWSAALRLPEELEAVTSQLSGVVAQNANQAISLQTLRVPLQILLTTVTELDTYAQHSYLVSAFSPQAKTRLAETRSYLEAVTLALTQYSSGTATWVVLMQNTDELRATGGFAGSYALITIKNGTVEPPVIEDIYDADGQFTGYVAAPAGVREYTSNNNGLRLPDANWYPEFAHSAQTILQFFALGNRRSLAGVGAINLSVIEDMLRVTGPLTIPDYNVSVTADTLHSVLREERGEFFPGSIQKKHLLSLTFSLLQQKLATLSPEQQKLLVAQLIQRVASKDIQLYAVDPAVQEKLTQTGFSPVLEPTNHTISLIQPTESCATALCPHLLLAFIESNVGINKVNRYVSREVALQVTNSQEIKGTITFRNSAKATDLTPLAQKTLPSLTGRILTAQNGYANYQRILTSPELQVKEVSVNGIAVSPTTEHFITPSQVTVDALGFLVTVLPQANTVVQFTLVPQPSAGALSDYTLFLFKQSGLAPPLYTVATPHNHSEFTLSSDTLVSLK